MTYRRVTTADGVTLAVRESGPVDAPVIVCVHGYPDDGTLWDGVRALLDKDFRVVAYDVRGAGSSTRPAKRSDYRLERLAEDLRTVIDDVSPDRPVHLLAHDWGSCQSWYALGRQEPPRVGTFTSISGPSLAHGSRWIKTQLRRRTTIRKGLWQIAHSSYIAFFRMPWMPVVFIRLGLFAAVLRTDRSRRGSRPSRDDAIAGLEIYRANMGRSLSDAAVAVPVLVIAPNRDSYISVGMQTEVEAIAPDLRTKVVDGGHWLPLSKPSVIADAVREFVGTGSSLDGGEVSA